MGPRGGGQIWPFQCRYALLHKEEGEGLSLAFIVLVTHELPEKNKAKVSSSNAYILDERIKQASKPNKNYIFSN